MFLLATFCKQRKTSPVIGRKIGFMNDKVKVLIVEDEPRLMMCMIMVLTMVGCDVEEAHTAKLALEKAAEIKFDLITLDIGLPDADGFSLCRELKQRHISRCTPIVFISASTCEEDRKQSFDLGAVDYIEKPFKANSLVSRLLVHVPKAHPSADSPFDEEFP